MPEPMSRAQALRVLALSSSAGRDDVKRAYRQLAREHHPDRGGDPDTFHEVARAFHRLAEDDTRPTRPRVTRGRPSRPAAPSSTEATADLASVDWATPVPEAGSALDRDRLAVALAQDTATAIFPITAVSRSPGSRLNGLAPHLAGNAMASLTVAPDTDDRGRPVIALQVRARSRRARRALEATDLQGRWTRMRGSSHTLLRSTFTPSAERQVSAAFAAERTDALLEMLGWGLPSWTLSRVRD